MNSGTTPPFFRKAVSICFTCYPIQICVPNSCSDHKCEQHSKCSLLIHCSSVWNIGSPVYLFLAKSLEENKHCDKKAFCIFLFSFEFFVIDSQLPHSGQNRIKLVHFCCISARIGKFSICFLILKSTRRPAFEIHKKGYFEFICTNNIIFTKHDFNFV